VVFITHDLALLLEISDRLAVMYAGQVIEYAPAEQVAVAPLHPYTRGLLRSFPDLRGGRRDLRGIPGSPPDLRNTLTGCPFAPRCESVFEPCADVTPQLLTPSGHGNAGAWPVACHLHDPEHAGTGTGSGKSTGTGTSNGTGTSGGNA
jgi:peptide/nickel transport system ATP-binding protein